MTEISPPPRRRKQAEPSEWLPLCMMQKTHGFWRPESASPEPDPRFKPIRVAISPQWLKVAPAYIKETLDKALKLTADNVAVQPFHETTSNWAVEWICREKAGFKLLPDDVFSAMTDIVEAKIDDIMEFRRSMFTMVDGKLSMDFSANTNIGFYCDAVLVAEAHYGNVIRPVVVGDPLQRVAPPPRRRRA